MSVCKALLAIGVVLLGTWLSQPDENIAGRWDPGIYLAQAAMITEGHSFHMQDPAGALLTTEERAMLYTWGPARGQKFAGFYLKEKGDHHWLEPSFSPLYPVLAGGVYQLAGMRAAQHLAPLFLWSAVVAVFFVGCRLQGRLAGGLAAAVLALNPVQMWFFGFHTAEALMQGLIWMGVALYVLWLQERKAICLLASGLLFSMTLLTSVTGWIWVLCFLVGHCFVQGVQRCSIGFILVHIPAVLLWWLYREAAAVEYMESVSHTMGAFLGHVLKPVVIAAFLILLIFLLSFRRRILDARAGKGALIAAGVIAVGVLPLFLPGGFFL